MKKNLFLRLCLMMAVVLSTYSCRQDILSEQETYHNTNAFQLTSKRISLNEAKHKTKLIPELGKVEAEFKKLKTNTFGKIINYGNGVSIDTDDVIYIENGSNYYTYTFRINRENAPADAPIENLVLSPLSDGSWKEVLVIYTLTAQEKQTMLSGGAVDLNGKVTKETLQSGTYSSGIMNKGLADECFMMTYSYYTSCSENAHHHGEAADEDGGPCEAETQSVLVVTQALVCPNPGGSTANPGGNESGTTPGGFNPSGGGATTNPNDPNGSNGGNNPNQPCDGNGIPSQPQDPSSTLGNQPCNNGTVTLPNLGGNIKPKTPCEKIKKIGKQDKTKALFENLKTKTNSTKEFGELLQENNGQVDNASIEGEIGQAGISFNINGQIDGFLHSHYVSLLSVFSPADLATLSGLYKNGNIKDPDTFVLGLVTASNTQYMIVIDDLTKFNIFAGEFITADGQINYDYIETYTRWNYAQYNILYNNLSSVNELGFVKFLLDKNSGLKVLKGSNNSNTWEELRIKDGKIDPVPCN